MKDSPKKHTFTQIDDNLMVSTSLKANQKLVIAYCLRWQMKKGNTCRKSNEELAKQFGEKYDTIRGWVRGLNQLPFFQSSEDSKEISNKTGSYFNTKEMIVDEEGLIHYLANEERANAEFHGEDRAARNAKKKAKKAGELVPPRGELSIRQEAKNKPHTQPVMSEHVIFTMPGDDIYKDFDFDGVPFVNKEGFMNVKSAAEPFQLNREKVEEEVIDEEPGCILNTKDRAQVDGLIDNVKDKPDWPDVYKMKVVLEWLRDKAKEDGFMGTEKYRAMKEEVNNYQFPRRAAAQTNQRWE